MGSGRARRLGGTARHDVVRFLDSYASLLVLLLANFFLLELVDDPRWGAIGSTLLSAAALVVAISDPEAGHRVTAARRWASSRASRSRRSCCWSTRPRCLRYVLLPVGLLVTATLPVTLRRVLQHRRITYETVLGALCSSVLLGLLFAFCYLAVDSLREAPFSRSPASTASRSSSTSASSA